MRRIPLKQTEAELLTILPHRSSDQNNASIPDTPISLSLSLPVGFQNLKQSVGLCEDSYLWPRFLSVAQFNGNIF